jgi:hypothetical protein
MIRLPGIVIVAILAACTRQGPPAPLLSCNTQQQVVVIDGTSQAATARRCRDDHGEVTLR